MICGVVSDTHGYVDERLLLQLRGVDLILHAGDIGSAEVLTQLATVAPIFAVEGNNDAGLGLGVPPRLLLELDGHRVQVVHQIEHGQADCDVLVHGHSHRARNDHVDGRLYLNPGAAGRRGFHAVQTMALLRLQAGRAPEAEIVTLVRRLPTGARRPHSSR